MVADPFPFLEIRVMKSWLLACGKSQPGSPDHRLSCSSVPIGKALQSLVHGDLLVIGSGFSFHNMGAFSVPETRESRAMNQGFEDWLPETCSCSDLNENQRVKRLAQWEKAPSARFCHPREEHLLPLHVCYGMAQTNCSECFELRILNKKSSMYLW